MQFGLDLDIECTDECHPYTVYPNPQSEITIYNSSNPPPYSYSPKDNYLFFIGLHDTPDVVIIAAENSPIEDYFRNSPLL